MKDFGTVQTFKAYLTQREICSLEDIRLYLVHRYWEIWSRSSHVHAQPVGWLKCWLELRFKLRFRPRFILRLKVWFRLHLILGFAVQLMHRKGAVAVLVSVSSIKRCANSVGSLKLFGTANDSFGDQIDDLTDTEHYAECRSSDHEVGEDSFLCGSANVTVHNVGTRLDVTLHQPW